MTEAGIRTLDDAIARIPAGSDWELERWDLGDPLPTYYAKIWKPNPHMGKRRCIGRAYGGSPIEAMAAAAAKAALKLAKG